MSIPSRMKDRALIVSPKKQVNYDTLVPDVDLQTGVGRRLEPKAPVFAQPESAWWTNRDNTMKGHDFTTERREISRDIQDSIQLDGDTWSLAWALAFGMGAISSVQPNIPGNPTVYDHTITPLDPASAGKDLPVTTIYTEVANVAGFSRKVHSCAIREVSIEFPPSGPPLITANFVGSGELTTAVLATPPSIVAPDLLLSQDLVFAYGPQAAPVDISSRVVPGSVRFGFGWGLDDENARRPHATKGIFRHRAWVGRPDITLEWQEHVDDADATPFDDWQAGTVREVKINLAGQEAGTGPEVFQLEIRGLAVRPDIQRLGQSGDKTVYQFTIGPDHWFKEAAADVITAIVTNEEVAFLNT